MLDRSTKLLLLAIAVGLWMNVADPWIAAPAQAQSRLELAPLEAALQSIGNRIDGFGMQVGTITTRVREIEEDIDALANGSCRNRTLCGTAVSEAPVDPGR